MTGDRDIPPDETNWPCHVGSGECHRPATKIFNDGTGGDFYICATHLPEFEALVAKLAAHPELTEPLTKAIAAAE